MMRGTLGLQDTEVKYQCSVCGNTVPGDDTSGLVHVRTGPPVARYEMRVPVDVAFDPSVEKVQIDCKTCKRTYMSVYLHRQDENSYQYVCKCGATVSSIPLTASAKQDVERILEELPQAKQPPTD